MNINRYCLFPPLTNWELFCGFSKKTFSVPSLLIADFFEEMDKLFFLFRSEMACHQGFAPSLIPNGVGVCTPPFTKRIFHPKTKNSRKPFIYGIFRLKKYFEIFLKFIEKRVKICYNDKKVNLRYDGDTMILKRIPDNLKTDIDMFRSARKDNNVLFFSADLGMGKTYAALS